MSHNHETVSKQKHPTSKLVRVCDAVAIVFYIIIVGGFYLYISRNVGVQYDYYEKPFVFCLPYVIWISLSPKTAKFIKFAIFGGKICIGLD